MSIKMIAVDMDGTFLNNEAKYNVERFRYIYSLLKERNIQFVIASGNPCRQLQGFFEEWKDELIFIAENGGYIVDKNEEIYEAYIDMSDAQVIIDALKKMPEVLSWVCTKDQSYTLDTISDDYYEMFLPYFPGVKKVQDFSLVNHKLVKFALYLPLKNVEKVIHYLKEVTSSQICVVDSGHYCVDLIPNHVNKGEAIKKLMKKYNLKKNEIMAFGDAYNDEAMLKVVQYGYAMENANDDFKNMFDYIAPSHNKEGVLEVIENYLLTGKFLNLK
ncbi:MAG: HAD family phosphatase [Coprobacillus sp.]|nr:HAD family phosphatase [Coprobacillus sp.]